MRETPAEPQAYKPGLGDLMTMTVQPRHTKLGLAGQEKNWVYAAYEQHELQEAFDRAARVWPMYRKSDINALLASTMKEPMEAGGRGDPRTTSMSARSTTPTRGSPPTPATPAIEATERNFVVIRVPRASPFPDQDFRPVKP